MKVKKQDHVGNQWNKSQKNNWREILENKIFFSKCHGCLVRKPMRLYF